MTNDEIYSYYDENWNDYNLIMDMLHNILDDQELEIKALKSKLNNKNNNESLANEIEELKITLLECQDKLDEETHK